MAKGVRVRCTLPRRVVEFLDRHAPRCVGADGGGANARGRAVAAIVKAVVLHHNTRPEGSAAPADIASQVAALFDEYDPACEPPVPPMRHPNRHPRP